MSPVDVVLTYSNGMTFLTGFNSMADAQAWVANEQQQPYWQSSTQVAYNSRPAQPSVPSSVSLGLQCQQVGAQCIAQVYALNDAKFAAGTLTQADFQSILADTTLQQIERLLWAGALATAQNMLSTYTSPYYTSADIATVSAIITNSGLMP
jgi:hypothetical protein